VSVLVIDLMIPVTEDYVAMTTWIKMSGVMGRALKVVILT
jgi:hypothetical protein